jgi:hypothetical protein
MMPDLSNAFVQWLLSQVEGIPPDLLREGADSLTLDRLVSTALGTRESANLRVLLDTPADMEERSPAILIPGIMGSLLASTKGISAILWLNPTLLMSGYLNLLDVAEDGESDASPDVDIIPFGIEKLTYLHLIQECCFQCPPTACGYRTMGGRGPIPAIYSRLSQYGGHRLPSVPGSLSARGRAQD